MEYMSAQFASIQFWEYIMGDFLEVWGEGFMVLVIWLSREICGRISGTVLTWISGAVLLGISGGYVYWDFRGYL